MNFRTSLQLLWKIIVTQEFVGFKLDALVNLSFHVARKLNGSGWSFTRCVPPHGDSGIQISSPNFHLMLTVCLVSIQCIHHVWFIIISEVMPLN